MRLNGVEIADTFAEAFPMKGTRVIVTAHNEKWAQIAAAEMSGNATSVIACDCETALETTLLPEESPDGRPGVSLLVFAFDRDSLAKAVQGRVGQCVLTTPTSACFNGISDCPSDKKISVGGALRYFGDGFQFSKKLGNRRFWRIPTMDGEFLCEDTFGTVTGVGGGNLIILGESQASALASAEAAVEAISTVPDVILPFPGGIVRSGSKVGSQYPKLRASTNDAYCPTLRPLVESNLPENCQCVYELVIDGLSFDSVQAAMRVGIQAATQVPGILRVTAGNYGGKLGKHHFHLRELL
ncbi:formylmethanofuran--tetrahydromethanopterin N-formyltransferase [Thalassoglobus sp. JC818]|uniref:formylmethanofuran--tetrahydromethanopterin N-formyltransferase n=1 Tax=Thalassoglobus sp. JC818 TaxID=3232136 RepID=UPI00345AC47E